MQSFYTIECVLCHKKTTEKETTSVCLSCGGPLEILYDYEALKKSVNTYLLKNAPQKVIKYLDFYPITKRQDLKTLGEGGTTLHHAKNLGKLLGLTKLYIKNEGLNPTGAFKDRGSFVELNKAKELGFKKVCVASTGNMAASVSAYAAQVGMECFVFVPENTPKGKLAQAISYGANVIQVRGTYTDAYNLTMEVAKKYGYYLAGDYVFRGEGQKSLSYEVCEQLEFRRVDWVVVPVGMGTHFAYIWKGFVEYYMLGLIQKLPRMIAVQAQGASPLVTAFEKKKPLVPVEKPHTVCSAIAIGNPIDAPKAMRAIHDSKGLAISVEDDATLRAQQELAKSEAIYVEPSSATVIAAIHKLRGAKIIKHTDTVVCVMTGAGLKDPVTTLKVLAEPPTIEPLLSEVQRVMQSGLLTLRAGAVGEKEKVLFRHIPALKEIKQCIKVEFGMDLDHDTVEIVRNVIKQFVEIKGKTIAKADLQSIIETVMQDERREKVLKIVDYHIETFKTKKPFAEVEVSIKGKIHEAKAHGVGPVDAAINAITLAIRQVNGFPFHLTDYNVEIPTTGSDATVEVTMVLQDDKGTQIVEKGTSPDIIVASVEAYEKGYNELEYQREKNRK